MPGLHPADAVPAPYKYTLQPRPPSAGSVRNSRSHSERMRATHII